MLLENEVFLGPGPRSSRDEAFNDAVARINVEQILK